MISVLRSGGTTMVPCTRKQRIYIRHDKEIHSDPTSLVTTGVPRPGQATFSRIIKNSFLMQEVSIKSSEIHGTFEIKCLGGKELILLELEANDRLTVNFTHLIGFSESLKFKSCANLSVTAFACDRNFVSIAQGPGFAILETHGNYTIHRDSTIVIDPELLIAWDPRTRFRLSGVHRWRDIYFNRLRVSCNLTPGLSPLIIDSKSINPRTSANPLLRMIKSVYLPRLN